MAPGISSRAKRLIPWVGAALLLTYIGLTTHWESAWQAIKQADFLPILSIVAIGTLITFAVDTLGVMLAVRQFVAKVTWRQTLPVKATSYLLNVINYNAALVGMAWYFKRIRDVSFWRAFGCLFVLNFMDILALAVLAAVGLLLNMGSDALDPVAVGLAWTFVLGAAAGFPLMIFTIQLGLRIPILSTIAKWQMLAPFREFRWRALPTLLASRLALLLGYFTIQFCFFPQFGVHVPFAVMFFYFPLGTLVQAIPIAPSGLGTMHAFNRFAYSAYVDPGLGASDGVLDACTTSQIILGLLVRVVVAWAFMGKFSKEVIQQASQGAEAPEELPAGDGRR